MQGALISFYANGDLEWESGAPDQRFGVQGSTSFLTCLAGYDGYLSWMFRIPVVITPRCVAVNPTTEHPSFGVFVSNCEQREVGTGTPSHFKKASHWPEGVEEIVIGGEHVLESREP